MCAEINVQEFAAYLEGTAPVIYSVLIISALAGVILRDVGLFMVDRIAQLIADQIKRRRSCRSSDPEK